MTSLATLGARLTAVLLALSLLPTPAFTQQTVPAVHPWKQALAKRMAREGMNARERSERRAEALRAAARRAKAAKRAAARPAGDRARPALPDEAFTPAGTWTPARLARRFGAHAFSTPVNRIVNDRTGNGPSSGQCETSIVAFGDLMLAAWNDSELGIGSGDTQGWASSNDGGITWIDRGTFPHPAGVSGFIWTSDPVLAVNEKTGAFYFSALCNFSNGLGARSGIAVVKGGWSGGVFSWGTPVIARDVDIAADFLDKEWVVADSVSGRVYLSYTRFPSGLARVEFQWADGNAAAWSAPQSISLNNVSENGYVQGSRPVVDGDGRLYVVYELIGAGFSDYYRIRRSDNLGVSFGSVVTAESLYTNFGTGAPGFNRNRGIEFAGISADRSHGPNRGRVYLSWAESINWLDEVFDIGLSGSKSEVEGNNSAALATPASVGQTLRGSVSSGGDVDFYSLVLAQGDHIVIAADSVESGPVDAMRMRLLAGDGVTRLTYTTIDDGVNPPVGQPFGFPAGWMFTAPSAGTYHLVVSPLAGTGSYRIRTGFVHRDSERGRDQRDIFVGWSDDGTTWSTPVRVNEDAPGFDGFTPEVAVAPDGGVYAAWYDYRDAALAKDGGEAGVYLARSGDGGLTWTTLGALADTLSDWTATSTNIEPNQGDYLSLFVTSSNIHAAWSDGRRGNPDTFAARTPLIPNGAQVAFVTVRLAIDRISIDWSTQPADTLTMRLYRSEDGGPFQYLDVVQFSAAGALTYADTSVSGGHEYTYRLGRFTTGVELFYGEVRVFLPSLLYMAPPSPNPVVGSTFTARFSLATNDPADLTLHDISGREVFRQRISLGRGSHVLVLPVGGGLKQGMYVLTVRQNGRNASTRVQLLK